MLVLFQWHDSLGRDKFLNKKIKNHRLPIKTLQPDPFMISFAARLPIKDLSEQLNIESTRMTKQASSAKKTWKAEKWFNDDEGSEMKTCLTDSDSKN